MAAEGECKEARRVWDELLVSLCILRNTERGNWEMGKKIEHLEVSVDMEEMKVYVTDRKFGQVRKLAVTLVGVAQRNRRLVSMGLSHRFCGVWVSLTLSVPMTRSFTRSIYLDMSPWERRS